VRQRTRWYQGVLQCWSRIPQLVRSDLRLRVVNDLMFHLLISVAVLLTGLLSVTFVGGMLYYFVADPGGAIDFVTSGGAWRLGVWYLAAFALSWIYAYVYWLVTPSRRFGRVLVTAHVFLLYTYIWVVAGLWALWRMASRRSGWQKTSRTSEAEASHPVAEEAAPPDAVGAPGR
jgi:uncharacterized membrane protein